MMTHPALIDNPHVPQDNPALPEDTLYDPWHWEAVYDDGSHLCEYNPETGEHRPFALALEHLGRLTHLILQPRYPERYPGLTQVVMQVPEGARALFFRQRDAYLIQDPDGPLVVKPRITALGWRQGDAQALLACYDDGSAFLTADRSAL
jgi:hypothetical protein